MSRRIWADATSKFEEQIRKESSDYWDSRMHVSAEERLSRSIWERPKYSQKRAPLWIERTRGHTSLCRCCGDRIKKDTMRFGTHSPNPYGWQAYYWHPYCYTLQVLKELAYAEEMEEKA
jgi:hypothetical protein